MARRVVQWSAIVVLCLVLVACAGATAKSTSTSEPRLAEPIVGLEVVDESHLLVTHRMGDCQIPAGHTVNYEPDSVTVTMFSKDAGDPGCLGGFGEVPTKVSLDEPLNGRRVVDGACLEGQQLAGSSDCVNGFPQPS